LCAAPAVRYNIAGATLQTAFAILWNPAGAATRAAGASLLLPLLLLAVAAAFPDYALLLPHGATQLSELKIQNTPAGMFPASIFLFIALMWLAPFLLPLGALLTGYIADYYVGFVLDSKTVRSECLRIVAWGFLPAAIGKLFTGVLTLACRDCDVFNPLAANLAFFLDPRVISIQWYETARGVDLFGAWAALITGWALGARYERSPGGTALFVGILFLLWAFLRGWMLG
jgi:hypothetical protein